VRQGSSTGGGPGSLATGVRAKISGFVLAGGRSLRLGQDKALLPWPSEGNGQTMLQHAIARLQSVCATVSICADRDDLPGAEIVIPDAMPGSGPLGGIVAALEHATTDWNFILAVDLPLLPIEVLQALAARAYSAKGNDGPSRSSSFGAIACILPEVGGLPQPLCGLYRRALAPGLRRALEGGKFKVMAALGDAVRNPASGPELQPASPALRIELWDAASFAAAMKPSPDPTEWFLNINTLEDWRKTQRLRFQ
jgi:molybdopterin-guanine dinucleotide biosynthesis protein A